MNQLKIQKRTVIRIENMKTNKILLLDKGGGGMEIPKIETKLEIQNEAEKEQAELYLYGPIRQAYYWEDDADIISSKKVRDLLNEIGNKDLNVYINSAGGDVFESIAIHNALKRHKGNVDVYIDGLAGSGASIITMAGDKIHMPKNTMMMIHKAWTIALGNADEIRKVADNLDKVDSTVKASYEDRFVGTEEELEQLISDESWLNAQECYDLGLCEEVIEEVKADDEESEEVEDNIKQTLLNKYSKKVAADVKKEKDVKNHVVGDDKPTLFSSFKKIN
jgi:ATP-dependent protease ClpP protease subunit